MRATTKREGSIEIFCSYAHKDEALHEEFAAHTAEMNRRWVQLWYDRLILPGAEWKEEIDDRLNRADVVLLFITSDFMSSGYCYGDELNQAMIRQARKEAIIVPIIGRSCDWEDAAFARFQALPSGAKPVTKWADRDEDWTDVVLKLKMTVKDRLERARERLNNAFDDAVKLYDPATPGAKGDWRNAMTFRRPKWPRGKEYKWSAGSLFRKPSGRFSKSTSRRRAGRLGLEFD